MQAGHSQGLDLVYPLALPTMESIEIY